jgi:hypothetical protein
VTVLALVAIWTKKLGSIILLSFRCRNADCVVPIFFDGVPQEIRAFIESLAQRFRS